MTVRELLEAAAKAEGHAYPWVLPAGFGERPWNPLTDDGDALRLAVALHFTVRCYMGSTVAQSTVPGGLAVYIEETNHTDPAAATRRAIVRAAAALSGDAGGVR